MTGPSSHIDDEASVEGSTVSNSTDTSNSSTHNDGNEEKNNNSVTDDVHHQRTSQTNIDKEGALTMNRRQVIEILNRNRLHS